MNTLTAMLAVSLGVGLVLYREVDSSFQCLLGRASPSIMSNRGRVPGRWTEMAAYKTASWGILVGRGGKAILSLIIYIKICSSILIFRGSTGFRDRASAF